ncbi:hypothetical protein RJ640_003063 [Escallonia rubra]|uniref:Myb/SANT-like domain-containing protein n=1 Tax=Escallonia rubra TaxID=112253 RepID=A0AA88R7N3_9ASTE|nr:hypothetical protein RJ640_003063 [Escallonia rubra]
MDRCLIVLMLEQVQRGNKIDLTFDNQLWAGITRSFNKKLGLQYNKCVLQDRYMCLMKEYTDVQSLLHRDGFKWDETQQMVAADNGVWEAYFKENPHASPIRGKILGDHMDLCMILRDGIVDGSFMSQSEGMQVDHTTLGMEIIDICGDIRIAGTETETSRERKSIIGTETSHEREKRPTASHSASGRSTKVQKTGKEDVQEAFTDIVSKMGDTKADKTYSTIESAIDALQVIPNLEDELLLDACDLLEDERKAKTFLALGVSLRKKWLLRKLGH